MNKINKFKNANYLNGFMQQPVLLKTDLMDFFFFHKANQNIFKTLFHSKM